MSSPPCTKISDAQSHAEWDFFNHLSSESGLGACAVLGSVLGSEHERASRMSSGGWNGVGVPSGDPRRSLL